MDAYWDITSFIRLSIKDHGCLVLPWFQGQTCPFHAAFIWFKCERLNNHQAKTGKPGGRNPLYTLLGTITHPFYRFELMRYVTSLKRYPSNSIAKTLPPNHQTFQVPKVQEWTLWGFIRLFWGGGLSLKPYPYSWSVMWSNAPDLTGGVASETPRGLCATHRSNKRWLWRHRAFRERGAMWDWHLESKWPNPKKDLKWLVGTGDPRWAPAKKTESFTPLGSEGPSWFLWEEVTCSFSRQVDGWILRLTMISCAVLMGDEEHSWSGFRMSHFSICFLFVTRKSYGCFRK